MKEIEFSFKGTRDYLHSTTVFDYIATEFDCSGDGIDFVFNKKTDKNCLITTSPPDDRDAIVGTYRDKKCKLYIVEGNTPMKGSVDYPENRIGEFATFGEKSITIPEIPELFSDIERMVGGFKLLLGHCFPENPGGYAFARLRIDHVPTGEFKIEFRRKMSDHFFEGIIMEESQRVGAIYFGEWQ